MKSASVINALLVIETVALVAGIVLLVILRRAMKKCEAQIWDNCPLLWKFICRAVNFNDWAFLAVLAAMIANVAMYFFR